MTSFGATPYPFILLDPNPDAKRGKVCIHSAEEQKVVYEAEENRFIYSAEQQERVHGFFCGKLYNAVVESEDYWSRLDSIFSQILRCNFNPWAGEALPAWHNIRVRALPDPHREPAYETGFSSMHKIVAETSHLLSRLPTSPVELPDASLFPGSTSAHGSCPGNTAGWQNLDAVSLVSTNVIRVALMITLDDGQEPTHCVKEFIDRVAELLSTASRLAALAVSSDEKRSWFLIRAFLWASWQRSIMLYFYGLVCHDVLDGFMSEKPDILNFKIFNPIAGMSIQQMSKKFAATEKPTYMCGWAFELIRSSQSAIALDFRNFFRRFAVAFVDRDGRCISDPQSSCKGEEPGSCQRFRGLKIRDQSAHHNCSGGCERLTWDRNSYISVHGGRAVDCEDTEHTLIYRQATSETLAVSHVWSHGQGGRPEVGHGMNHCLHQRYSSIARSLDCHSYWMDTACIPEDHNLRREAISKINEVFENSKATLVCDRDLMSIDATNLSVEICETIIVTVMVCDWNLRAWTFLEAVRGRHNIYILCKDQRIISLREVASIAIRHASLDIVLLLLNATHLLPKSSRRRVLPYLNLETAGCLLSHREASRPGDNIVIWNLLLGNEFSDNAKAFWKGKEGQNLQTSFLFSSAPRLKTRTLRWAPSSPTAELLTDKSDGSKYRLLATVGRNSTRCRITKDGLDSEWRMYTFGGGFKCFKLMSYLYRLHTVPEELRYQNNLHYIRQTYLRGYDYGALLRPTGDAWDPIDYRSNAGRIIVAVCGAKERRSWTGERDNRSFWTWRGIYEWDDTERLPKFTPRHRIWIV
ncbi:hypothetical protein G7Y79_00059g091590 [Physcia stellaris]|nr:hypothetical protein G7Y79_00059g091590 [Physcia stellaris]